MPEFISTTQAAQRLGLTREQVLRRIGRGAITAQYVGGRWLVEESSVEEYVRRRAAQGRARAPGSSATFP